eukprot:3204483-Amphidinium_carterae.1
MHVPPSWADVGDANLPPDNFAGVRDLLHEKDRRICELQRALAVANNAVAESQQQRQKLVEDSLLRYRDLDSKWRQRYHRLELEKHTVDDHTERGRYPNTVRTSSEADRSLSGLSHVMHQSGHHHPDDEELVAALRSSHASCQEELAATQMTLASIEAELWEEQEDGEMRSRQHSAQVCSLQNEVSMADQETRAARQQKIRYEEEVLKSQQAQEGLRYQLEKQRQHFTESALENRQLVVLEVAERHEAMNEVSEIVRELRKRDQDVHDIEEQMLRTEVSLQQSLTEEVQKLQELQEHDRSSGLAELQQMQLAQVATGAQLEEAEEVVQECRARVERQGEDLVRLETIVEDRDRQHLEELNVVRGMKAELNKAHGALELQNQQADRYEAQAVGLSEQVEEATVRLKELADVQGKVQVLTNEVSEQRALESEIEELQREHGRSVDELEQQHMAQLQRTEGVVGDLRLQEEMQSQELLAQQGTLTNLHHQHDEDCEVMAEMQAASERTRRELEMESERAHSLVQELRQRADEKLPATSSLPSTLPSRKPRTSAMVSGKQRAARHVSFSKRNSFLEIEATVDVDKTAEDEDEPVVHKLPKVLVSPPQNARVSVID